MLLVRNIHLSLEEAENEIDIIRKRLVKKLKVSEDEITNFRILKESIDARKRNNIILTYQVLVEVRNEKKFKECNDADIKIHYEDDEDVEIRGDKVLENRPIIIGYGPSGMFCALKLAKSNLKPIVFEMGQDVDDRKKSIDEFWKSGKLNTRSNVQFGEGGAGTFSDGKLTTRIKDNRINIILKELIDAGAPEEILYKSKPHIGTDILKEVVKNIRLKTISLGGEINFNSYMEDLIIKNNEVVGVKVNGVNYYSNIVILALGHSSRDTYEMIYNKKIAVEAKAFAVGLRVEHEQSLIDESQYGKFKNSSKLRSSEYTLSHKASNGRGVYSFCMCPGGMVVNSSSEEGRLCVNGMSYHARDRRNANSAIIVSISPEDFGNNPLDGIKFQREYEEKAYIMGGANYHAPVQTTNDFLNDRVSTKLNNVTPEILPGFKFINMNELLPKYINESIAEGMMNFGRKIKGFDTEGIFTGIETRTSAPVRIIRKENFESINIKGLFPIGEGAGYAGGIMSASVDGYKVAQGILSIYGSVRE